MIQCFKKKENKQLYPDFHTNEFHCHCKSEECYFTLIGSRMLSSLIKLRLDYNLPILVSSGYRCAQRNKVIQDLIGPGRVATTSSHMTGDAVDITPKKGLDDLEYLYELAQKYFKFVRIYETHIHCDTRLLKE